LVFLIWFLKCTIDCGSSTMICIPGYAQYITKGHSARASSWAHYVCVCTKFHKDWCRYLKIIGGRGYRRQVIS
jgi:hypothetical protein